jgi:uncharacterized Ntn-hydrolase superfamily protein|tara:strand:+ start:1283 stop:2017 length:735 start_codon:yes stop_codon:yes gene_type:complete
MALIDYGPLGLELMEQGLSATEALQQRLNEDEAPEIRQVAMVDSTGIVAAHTGSQTVPAAGHVIGEGFSCQANLMWSETVTQAMAEAFVNADGDLARRMLSAMVAGEEAGGDLRGMQSGRILVVSPNKMEKAWEEIIVDVSVDDHSEPLSELSRLLDIHSIYSKLLNDDLDFDLHISDATKFPEIAFWMGVDLANNGKDEEARKFANIALQQHSGWQELLIRCSKNGLIGITEETVRILLGEDH